MYPGNGDVALAVTCLLVDTCCGAGVGLLILADDSAVTPGWAAARRNEEVEVRSKRGLERQLEYFYLRHPEFARVPGASVHQIGFTL